MPARTPLPLDRVRRPMGLALSVLAAAALACSLQGAPPPTGTPVAPTALVPPPTDTPVAPSATPLVVPSETPAPVSPTDTPAAPEVPEVILITSPGTGSHLTSPLHVEGYADPTFEQNLVIQITDANGGVLATQPTTIQADAGSAGPFAADVAFTTPSDQPGRLSVYSTSARDGGLVHLASVEVDLVTSGASVVEPAEEHPEVHLILSPAPLAEVSGGTLHVEGYSDYVFEGTLNVWLCGEGGLAVPEPICGSADNVLATGFAMIQASDIGFAGPFAVDLPYTVPRAVQARLVVYSTSARDGGIIHLTTIPVNLAP